jgi:hypothetical protein
MPLYSLIKRKDTDELHLFNSRSTSEGCKAEQCSICQKMKLYEMGEVIFACKDENETRKECAKLGRKVCGVCASNLYATYE